MAPVSGDAATMRNARAGSDMLTLAMWTSAQAVGFTQVVSPSQHDMVRGYRYRNNTLALDTRNKVPRAFPLHWRPQDPLNITQAGSAVAGDVELCHMLNWYEDLPGVEANLINAAELRSRGVNLLTYEDTVTPTAASAYSGSRAINTASDLYKADTEYAILGIAIGTNVGQSCFTVRGVDFGNLRPGIPLNFSPSSVDTRDWFLQLSEWMDVPCIPVFNSANRAGTFFEAVANENFGAMAFSLILCQLAARMHKSNQTIVPAATA